MGEGPDARPINEGVFVELVGFEPIVDEAPLHLGVDRRVAVATVTSQLRVGDEPGEATVAGAGRICRYPQPSLTDSPQELIARYPRHVDSVPWLARRVCTGGITAACKRGGGVGGGGERER